MNIITKRILASFIDWYLITLPVYFIWTFGIDALPTVDQLLPRTIIIAVLGASYFLLKDLVFRNASIGKKLLGLKIVDTNNEKASVKSVVLRNLVLLFLVQVEIICFFIDNENRRLGDKWANTKVVLAR